MTGRSGADAGFSAAVLAGWPSTFAGLDFVTPTSRLTESAESVRPSVGGVLVCGLLVLGVGLPGAGARKGGGETDALARAAVGGLDVLGAGAEV